jgi:hypothetical protein
MPPSSHKQPIAFESVLWGMPAIAKHIKRSKRQVSYLIEKKKIRVDWIGPKTPVTTIERVAEDFAVLMSGSGEKPGAA